jgi:hypothetical protein
MSFPPTPQRPGGSGGDEDHVRACGRLQGGHAAADDRSPCLETLLLGVTYALTVSPQRKKFAVGAHIQEAWVAC